MSPDLDGMDLKIYCTEPFLRHMTLMYKVLVCTLATRIVHVVHHVYIYVYK